MKSIKKTQDRPNRIGPYRLEQQLGSGGMGEVWRAWDERLERHVALKQVRTNTKVRKGRERLRREARAAARLNHPAIVHIYDFLEGEDGDWIVMEFVEGRTLRDLLDEVETLPPARAVQLCREITEGLAEAHKRGILHRDLKTSNVIIATTGRAKILDFGLAKEIPRDVAAAEGWDLTASTPGMLLGTPFAMSPEQVLGDPLDERSDLFSLGSLFYEVLTGKAPFRAQNAVLSMARVAHGDLPPLQESNPELPPAVCDLVDWLLCKAPDHRPRSADEVLAALDSTSGTHALPLAAPQALAAQSPPISGGTSAVTLAETFQPERRSQLGDTLVAPRRAAALEAWEDDPLSPLVNREAEMQILLDRFRLARSGSGQAVLIAGEAGIGKSRLVRALGEQLASERPAWLAAHGSAFAQNMPLAPIVQLLSRTIFEEHAASSDEEKLRQLEQTLDVYDLPRAEYAPFLGKLLSVPTELRYPPLVLSPEAWRKRTRAAVLALLGAMAERHPLVLVIEDLHWIDPSTLDLLDQLLGEMPMVPLLLVTTFRPEFSPSWRHQTLVTQLKLGGLSEAHAVQLIEQVAEGKRLSAKVRREIVTRTAGIPLFVEELTKMALDTALQPAVGIPLTLGDSLQARLDRLGEAKSVAQLAAVIGRAFPVEQLEALSSIQGTALRFALTQLLRAEILQRRGPASRQRYLFRHALIQDAAYLSLAASDRQHLHLRLVRLFQDEFQEVAATEPETMAHHCERGGLTLEAIDYLQEAGLRAIQRSAPLEAASHLGRAVDLLADGTSERNEAAAEWVGRELAARSLLSPALGATQGWAAPEIALNAQRCTALCREMGDDARLIPALWGLWAYHLLRGQHQVIDFSSEIARLAVTPAQVFMGYSTRAFTAYHSGRFAEALALAKKAQELLGPDLLPELETYGFEARLMPYVYQAWALWYLGEPERALRMRDTLLTVADTPFLRATALFCEVTLLHDLRLQDAERVEDLAEQLIELAGEQEFAFLYAGGQCAKGWAICQRGDLAGGTELIQTGLDLYKSTGSSLALGYWSGYLVEAHLASGQLAEGLAAAREALTLSESQFDVKDDAGLLRLEGELLEASGDFRGAEASLRKALDIARAQGTRALELRAATSLTRLFAGQHREAEAIPTLRMVYRTYTEGFATPDLRDARILLDRYASL